MRFSHITFLALGGFLATAVASPVEARQESVALTYLTDLLTTVKTYTGAINATLATISASSSDADKAAAVTSVGSELTSLTDAISSVTASISGLTPVSKRSAIAISPAEVKPRQLGELALLGAALSALLVEVFATVSGAIAALGLTSLLSFLNPLTGGLGGLILAVEVLVDLLLLDVTVLLDELLTGLALGLGGLTL